MKKKGFKIYLISISIFILVAVIMVIFGFEVRQANIYVREQTQIEENRRLCEQASQALSDGSDYLTNEVFHFVATGNRKHLDNYWREVNEVRSRDNAIEQLVALSLTENELRLIEDAKKASDALIAGETWAMRLTADSVGIPLEKMPPELAALRYTEGEEAFTPEEKRNLAAQYLFGETYTYGKVNIKENIKRFRNELRDRKNAELSAAEKNTAGALRTVGYLMLALIAAFAAEVIIFYFFILRPFHQFNRALRKMGKDEFTALVPSGAYETRSFAERFNQIYLEWQKQKQSLEQEHYRFHVALENTSVIVYEYDVENDTYITSGSLEKSSHPSSQPEQEHILTQFLEKHIVGIMGQAGLDYFQRLLSGEECDAAELQVHPSMEDSRLLWSRITGTAIYNDDRRPVRLIGKISNIQSEKEKEFALDDARIRDGLTGLYKREAGIAKIREYMAKKSNDDICGIMILDMDHFAEINEAEGQAFGDAILQDVADIVRSMTGPDDILTRLGGDEIMLFIKGCPKSRATALGPRIADKIRELSDQMNTGPRISASIGMCVTEVVDEYSGLYRCAESTLKYIKENGRGRAACYLDTSNELGMMVTQMYPERHPINEIESQGGAREDLPAFALDLLGKSKNLDDAIFLLLSRMGRVCGLDRILMLELDLEYLSCWISCQWYKNAADRAPGEIRYLTKEEYRALGDAYDENGLCDRRIITGGDEMQSILHAAVWNYGQCVGAVSFEKREVHAWSQEEREILSEMTKIISSFTLKARADAVSRAKTDFLSRMSHEIRTPMNAISGMTIIAKTVPGNPAKTVNCLDKIEAANKYLLSLINDVLDMSRIESGKVEMHLDTVSIETLAGNLDTLIRPQADDKGQQFVIINSFAGQRRVLADELRLNQVLVNLLGNAVKFTDEGGSVTLEITPVSQDNRGAALRFAVTDSGIGISEEAQRRIFNAFEQAGSDTTSNYGGTGLGLAISSRLVQLMGGSLEVESELGKGSSFYFTIRLSYAPEGEETNAFHALDEVSFDPSGKRLLLVEDNQLNREIAQEILEMHGFIVECAVNGKESLELFEQREPGYYAAILMDIRMPVMGGMEAARRIRTMGKADSRNVPIIAMTANAFDDDMKKSLENGMDGHLSKPVDVDVLLKTLGKLIAAKKAAAVS